jgi:hypothetical protein
VNLNLEVFLFFFFLLSTSSRELVERKEEEELDGIFVQGSQGEKMGRKGPSRIRTRLNEAGKRKRWRGN